MDDGTHDVTGTAFRPELARKGNEELESWLLRLTNPRIHFRFHRTESDGKPIVILEIPRATNKPVSFSGQQFIRVGSYKKKLKDFPEKERALWRIFDAVPFEDLPAAERVPDEEVLRLLDYPAMRLSGRHCDGTYPSRLSRVGLFDGYLMAAGGSNENDIRKSLRDGHGQPSGQVRAGNPQIDRRPDDGPHGRKRQDRHPLHGKPGVSGRRLSDSGPRNCCWRLGFA
ncbi:MAG: RNA-binding domain-containing protein [Desulfosarcinaceae bacterium]